MRGFFARRSRFDAGIGVLSAAVGILRGLLILVLLVFTCRAWKKRKAPEEG